MSVRPQKPSLSISVDIEADGPLPGPYSMLSLGAAVAGAQSVDGFTAAAEARTSYRELRPISDDFVPEAPAVYARACRCGRWRRAPCHASCCPNAGTPSPELSTSLEPGGTPLALDDAIEQAELFARLMTWPGPGSAPVPG